MGNKKLLWKKKFLWKQKTLVHKCFVYIAIIFNKCLFRCSCCHFSQILHFAELQMKSYGFPLVKKVFVCLLKSTSSDFEVALYSYFVRFYIQLNFVQIRTLFSGKMFSTRVFWALKIPLSVSTKNRLNFLHGFLCFGIFQIKGNICSVLNDNALK